MEYTAGEKMKIECIQKLYITYLLENRNYLPLSPFFVN